MKIESTDLNGVLKITPPTIFEDFRGTYIETYNRDLLLEHGVDVDFKQDDISRSRRHVLRGIHGDQSTWKLVSCLYGAFYLVVVNNDPGSAEYRRWTSFTLSDGNKQQVLIPPKFGNGHLVLSDEAIFHYKQNSNYDRQSQFTLKWNDPDLAIWWPVINPLISIRDS
ncbi:MAG: dTDP-4-dehydrorhamnose 3,5-epimerase [Paracoccaceae bacterium]